MILVIGGRSQGKREFVCRELLKQRPEAINWCDGATATFQEFMESPFCFGLHQLTRRVMEGEPSLGIPNGWTSKEAFSCLIDCLVNNIPERIVITDEIGYGVVPVEASLRAWREETGRLCCELAAQAEEVWRVCCGIGQRLK